MRELRKAGREGSEGTARGWERAPSGDTAEMAGAPAGDSAAPVRPLMEREPQGSLCCQRPAGKVVPGQNKRHQQRLRAARGAPARCPAVPARSPALSAARSVRAAVLSPSLISEVGKDRGRKHGK